MMYELVVSVSAIMVIGAILGLIYFLVVRYVLNEKDAVSPPTEASAIIDADPDQAELYDETVQGTKFKWSEFIIWVVLVFVVATVLVEYV